MSGAAVATTILRCRQEEEELKEEKAKEILSDPKEYLFEHSRHRILSVEDGNALEKQLYGSPDEPQIQVACLKTVLKELDAHEKGFDKLLALAVVMIFFFVAVSFQYDFTFIYAANLGVTREIEGVLWGEDHKQTLYDVKSPEDFAEWLSSMGMSMYHGEVENTCLVCDVYGYSVCSSVCWNPDVNALNNVSDCSPCEYIVQYYPHCLDGTCSNYTIDTTSTSYSTDWHLDLPTGCSDVYMFAEKGMTSSHKKLFNGSNVEYSAGSGIIANQISLGRSGIVQWSRRPNRPCKNAEIQEVYGNCKDYESVIATNISAEAAENSFVAPTGIFEFNADAQMNGIYIDLGTYNFGGWNAYCLGPSLLASNALDNVEEAHVVLLGVNGQKNGLMHMIDVAFTFSSGGYVDANIDVLSFPVLDKYDPTDSELFSIMMLNLINLALPVLVILHTLFDFYRATRKLCWKMKIVYAKSWLQKPKNRCGLNLICLSLIFVGSVWVVEDEFSNIDFAFGQPLELARSGAIISGLISTTADLDNALAWLWFQNTMYLLLLLFLLKFIILQIDFHKRMALVAEVLTLAFLDLLHFAMVFFITLIVFVFIVTTLFGPYLEDFNSFHASVTSILRIGLGDSGDYYEDLLEVPQYGSFIGPILVLSMQIIIGLVLLNIVISICVDAYISYNQSFDKKNYWTVVESLLCYLSRKCLRIKFFLTGDKSRSEIQTWQVFFMKIFAREHRDHSRTLSKSVAQRILDFSPCARIFTNNLLSRIIEIQEEGKDLDNTEGEKHDPEVNSASKDIRELKAHVKMLESRLKDATNEIKRLKLTKVPPNPLSVEL